MDAPFLPPPAADNPIPQKKSPAKTFVIWFLLIVLFLALCNYFTISSSPQPSVAARIYDGFFSLLSYGWPFAIIGFVFFYLWWQFRNSVQFQLAQEPGLIALAEGQLDRAATLFQETIQKYKNQQQYAAVARHNHAVALRRQGNLARAIEKFIAVEKGAGLVYSAEIRLLAAIQLADCYALRGELAASHQWIDESRKRLARSSHRTHSACQLRLAEATLQCREGKFADALRGLERDWRQLEGNLAVVMMRTAWLLRAFALSHEGGPRDASAAPYLMMLRGQSLDHLAVDWPELKTFLATAA
jgi:tetratricopeptide (TPR) repeat protein